jgi:hypothetical protein
MTLARLVSPLAIALLTCAMFETPHAQKAPAPPPKKNPLLKLTEPWPAPEVLQARKTEAENRPLFQSLEPLAFTMTADFGLVNKDRDPNSTKRFPAVISVTDDKGKTHTINIKTGSRGHFRLMPRNCDFVPLRLEFPKDEIAGTVFDGQTSLKLGTHCQGDKAYDQYTMREYLAYRLFNLITPKSFRARLVKATYVDAKNQKTITTRYGLLIEHENDVARRMGGRVVELQRTQFTDVDAATVNVLNLFEYMIGNTDVSLWFLHNLRLVQQPDRTLFTVPYDFDLSGLVHAPYAIPDRRFGIRSVLDRLYRGPCRTAEEMEAAAAPFIGKKAEMLALIDGMTDLESSNRREAKDYLEGFFRTIEKPGAIKKQFVDGCKAANTM